MSLIIISKIQTTERRSNVFCGFPFKRDPEATSEKSHVMLQLFAHIHESPIQVSKSSPHTLISLVWPLGKVHFRYSL